MNIQRIRSKVARTALAATITVGSLGLAASVDAGMGACTQTNIGCTSSGSYSGYTYGLSSNTYRFAVNDPTLSNNNYANGLNLRYNTNSARNRKASANYFCGFTGYSYSGIGSFQVAYSYPGFYAFSQNRNDLSIRFQYGTCGV